MSGLDWTWLIDMLPSPTRVERDALGQVDYVEWTSRSGRSAVLAGDGAAVVLIADAGSSCPELLHEILHAARARGITATLLSASHDGMHSLDARDLIRAARAGAVAKPFYRP